MEGINKWTEARGRWKTYTRKMPACVEKSGIGVAVAFLGTLGSEMLPWHHALVVQKLLTNQEMSLVSLKDRNVLICILGISLKDKRKID